MTEKLFTKNFTLLILGQLTSLFGNFILKLALSMYVLEVTGSAAIFAGILSAATIPTILLSPLGGILADRADRRNIMVALDALTGVSVLCAALFLSESNAIAVISTLLIILSILGAFETPTVQACIPTMLQGDNIMKGNAVVNQVCGKLNEVLGISVRLPNPGKKAVKSAAVCNLIAGAGLIAAGAVFSSKWCAALGGLGIVSSIILRKEGNKPNDK